MKNILNLAKTLDSSTSLYIYQKLGSLLLSFEEVLMKAVLTVPGQYFRHHPRVTNFDGLVHDIVPLPHQSDG